MTHSARHLPALLSGPVAKTAALAVLGLSLSGCSIISIENVESSATPSFADQWDITWNQTLGTPALLTNRSLQDIAVSRSTPAASDSVAEAAARAVIDSNPDWFPLRPGVDKLVVVENRASEWLRQVKFQQTYRDVPIAGASYEARVFPNGRVGTIEGRLHANVEMYVTPSLSESIAESRANEIVADGAFRSTIPILRFDLERSLKTDHALVIVPWENGLALAWGITVSNRPREQSRVYVHAGTGEIIGRQLTQGSWMR